MLTSVLIIDHQYMEILIAYRLFANIHSMAVSIKSRRNSQLIITGSKQLSGLHSRFKALALQEVSSAKFESTMKIWFAVGAVLVALASSAVAWPSQQEEPSELQSALKYIENAVMMKELEMKQGSYIHIIWMVSNCGNMHNVLLYHL